MKKCIIFLPDRETILRFLACGAFEELEKQYVATYAVMRSEENVEGDLYRYLNRGQNRVVWIPLYPGRVNRWLEIFDVSCALYKERSSSFAVRHQERARIEPQRTARLEQYAHPGVFEQYRAKLIKEMGLHPEILALVNDERPDFVVIPSSLMDNFTDEVLAISERLNIPTLMLILGWDNLSSKGLLNVKPTMMGVWGSQSVRHAVEIQKMDEKRVVVVGAPHYENFKPSPDFDRKAVRNAWGLPLSKPLVLFAGTFRLFDETQLLKEMDAAIEQGVLPPVHILYRPHPYRSYRQHEENFFDHTWQHISMDPQMAAAYKTSKGIISKDSSDNFYSRIDYLSQLYQVVDCVISPMSTILLESLLFGLPILAVAFGDGKHSWSADKVSNMLHFKEMYEIPDTIVCRDREVFFEDIRRLLAQSGDGKLSVALQRSADQFVFRDEHSYGERVANLAGHMLAVFPLRPSYGCVDLKPGRRYRLEGHLQRLRKTAVRLYRRALAITTR